MAEETVKYLTNFEGIDPTTLPRYSISEHQLLTSSPQDWYYSYVEALKPKETPSYLSKGSFLHGLMERYYRAKVENTPFPVAQISAEVRANLLKEREAVVSEPDRLEVEAIFGRWAQAQASNTSETAIIDGVPAIELEFYADVGLRTLDDEPVALYGFIDHVAVENGGLVIDEHKTAARAWSQSQLQLNLQGPAYARVIGKLTGITPGEVRFNFFFKDKFNSQSIYPTEPHMDMIIQELQRGVWLRDSGNIYRSFHWSASTSSWANLNALELQGIDSTSYRDEFFTVDEDKKARYARWAR